MILSIIPTLTDQLQTLKCLYDTIDLKPMTSLLPLDILFFIHDSRYFILLRHIFSEIIQLRGETLPSNLSDVHLVQHLIDQDYGFLFSYQNLTEENIYLRLYLLSVIMGDLLIERLQHRKKIKDSISLVNKTTEETRFNITNSSLITKTHEYIQSCINVIIKMSLDTVDLSKEMYENQEKMKEFYDVFIDMVIKLHKEYSMRYAVIQKRFDITIQSFLWTKNLKTPLNVYKILQPYIESKNEKKCPYFTLLDIIIQGPSAWEHYGQNTKKNVEPCFLRSLKIGQVESRGGIPENYSNDHVRQEIQVSNRRMRNIHFTRRK